MKRVISELAYAKSFGDKLNYKDYIEQFEKKWIYYNENEKVLGHRWDTRFQLHLILIKNSIIKAIGLKII
ncbi:hypothetical protein DXN04_33675 [Chitinophaga silvisoli]|uniref:Uncharacterized protein n=1 Tax=Chitinophaga silvisoli TaxID=2291814 RepID=A0A3E1NMS9_9BACT|nr:hypothetical protein DXN04_33675 [Chitinophaga silvisoli]